MTRFASLKVGAIAALYLFWLATWLVLGTEIYGPRHPYWSHGIAAAVTGLMALFTARQTLRPYPGFLAVQGVALVILAVAWVSYPTSDQTCRLGQLFAEPLGAEQCDFIANSIYALCVFTLVCAWGYLAMEQWHRRSLSSFTVLVFAVLMLGLGAIFASFYESQYGQLASTSAQRLNAVTAALEFAVLVPGLFCMLLRVPSAVVWMLVGTVIMVAGDMAYSLESTPSETGLPPIIDALWMLGQIVLLAAVWVMPEARVDADAQAESSDRENDELQRRSGLSGVLILISLGAVLLAPLVWFLPVDTVWKSFFSVLFVIALVVILVWITDRFDDTVAYLRSYVRGTHQSRLVAEDWRTAPPRIRGALESTGLGAFAEAFRDSAARLKRDVLFLGPERLFGPPGDAASARQASCFIVMPFSQEWSADVHRILANACDAAGVRPVRGDDLFTPTDILEDIWQSINAADFVIADITGRNPNVLYELGIAHTLAKPVVILSKNAADIPVDLATRRVILYGQSQKDWRTDIAQKISRAVATIVEEYGLKTTPG